ncbi:hypothetical protein RHMOL_Rhmol06G0198700 [Rhododendron molle]|uniref:Uncharacterized protein n=1 Tax=Rhododendron molle TaxID=49168 RepID=A0ACC0NE45_RHOML|nr:hypothetical protein RHMOL_Rhmol06G0198700 [Rhododendron molle]
MSCEASVELQDIQGMWSLRAATDDPYDTFLVVSFISETRILAMNLEDELEETEIEDKLPMDFAFVDIMVFICSSSEFPDHQLFVEIPRVVKPGGMVLLHWSSKSAPGKMLIHLLDVSNQHICDQEVQILLVGYIQGLSNEVHNVNKTLELLQYHVEDDYAASDEKEYVFSD